MQAIFVTARGAKCRRVWVLDADLTAAFDQIDHARLLEALDTFPGRGMIEGWLRAGVMDQGRFARPSGAARKAGRSVPC